MKRRKEQRPEQAPAPRFSEKIKLFFGREQVRDFLLVFLLTFLFSTFVTLQQQPVDTHDRTGKGGDNWYYFHNAQLFSKVWSSPFSFLGSLFTDSLTEQELLSIGFNHYGDIDTFFRAPVYITYLSFWIFLFGESEIPLLLSQTLILGLIFALIFLIIRQSLGRKWAFAGVLLSLFYLSFYTAAVYTLTELFQTLLALSLFYYSRHLLSDTGIRRFPYVLLAVLFFLFAYSKIAQKFIYLFLIPLFLYFLFFQGNSDKKTKKKNTAVFLVSFMVLVLFYGLMSSRGRTNTPADLGGWRNFYAGSCVQAQGFGLNTGFHNKEFRDNLPRGTDQFWFNRYSEVCRYAVLDIIRHHPMAYISMTLKKIGLLLGYPPENYQSRSLLRQARYRYLNYYHFLLLLICIPGFILLDRKHLYFKTFFLFLTFYLAGIYGLSNPGTRYFIVISPFFLILSVLSINEFIIKKGYRNKAFLFFFCLCVIFSLLMNKNLLALVLGSIKSLIAVQIILFHLFLIISILLFLKNRTPSPDRNETVLFLLLSLFLYSLFMARIIDDRSVNHFSMNPGQIKEEIILSPSSLTGKEQALLALDIRTDSTNAELSININGIYRTNIKVIRSSCTIDPDYDLGVKEFYEPRWLVLPLELSKLKNTNTITIRNKEVYFYYALREKKKKIPSLFHFSGNLEDIIYGPYTRQDRRTYMVQDMKSLARSATIDQRPAAAKDAHIFLVLKGKGNYYIDKKYESFNQANLKLIALQNPIDSRIVFFSVQDPGPAFQKVSGNLYKYLAGEMDRFHPGYEFH
ncbi:MAG: glycosyltransferase family 39 protein [bacterium]|nr:glycosyltransferase family 39 protein [bacterium]